MRLLVVRGLASHKVNIADLSETRFSEQDPPDEVVAGYIFFGSGRLKAEGRDTGDAFSIRTIVGQHP
ncbi:hypothetical protein SprV_0200836000 [Sparganum proliferum]